LPAGLLLVFLAGFCQYSLLAFANFVMPAFARICWLSFFGFLWPTLRPILLAFANVCGELLLALPTYNCAGLCQSFNVNLCQPFWAFFAIICRPLAAWEARANVCNGIWRPLPPFKFGGLSQVNNCQCFAAAFVKVSVASLESQLAGIFQYNRLKRI
jgi:hypothetical protein